ncbi:DUF488 family protein [Leptospira idonii]|uniref:DUF488 domain-containing protein n=1 Tax=Leptospira idonii TaxID=1193500 RepID=A0A4R9M2W7_9LEPT|nr:DUF488 domain-containing protein [Leptospira idonii]TGN19639.1 DUF488 domain-containing protein [Leptospira idonii]
MKLFTIGFTKRKAKDFFETLVASKVKRVLDVRLNNVSQLAGFSKKEDLQYFLKKIGNIDYEHLTLFAPTQEMLDQYKKEKGSWADYEKLYLNLIKKRFNEIKSQKYNFEDSCLLCSEEKPHFCHRRVAAEFLKKEYDQNINIVHL